MKKDLCVSNADYFEKPKSFLAKDENVELLYKNELERFHESYIDIIYNIALGTKFLDIQEIKKQIKDAELPPLRAMSIIKAYENFKKEKTPLQYVKSGMTPEQATIEFLKELKEKLKHVKRRKGKVVERDYEEEWIPYHPEETLTDEEQAEGEALEKFINDDMVMDNLQLNGRYDMDLVAKISLQLKGISKFEVETHKEKSEDMKGKELIFRRMKDIDEIEDIPEEYFFESNIFPSQLELDILDNKMIVRKRARSNTQKQFIYILLDVSGSMNDTVRRSISFAIVLNRLQAVQRGECELYLSFFDNSVSKPKLITTRKEIDDMIKYFASTNSFRGGATYIQGAIAKAAEMIQSDIKQKYKPELIIITDGDDAVDKNKVIMSLKGIKFHSFLITLKNKNLKAASLESNGIYIFFDYTGTAKEIAK